MREDPTPEPEPGAEPEPGTAATPTTDPATDPAAKPSTAPASRSLTELVIAARADDQRAWRELVDRYAKLVWAIARRHGLSEADAADVAQNTWLNLAEHLDRIRHPERLAQWLCTTAKRESLRVLGTARKEIPQDRWDAPHWSPQWTPVRQPESTIIDDARASVLWLAFTTLPVHCQRLLSLHALVPELSYAQLANALGIVENSVGSSKGRCLALLRRRLATAGITEEAG